MITSCGVQDWLDSRKGVAVPLNQVASENMGSTTVIPWAVTLLTDFYVVLYS
jgi:hypothetical protein